MMECRRYYEPDDNNYGHRNEPIKFTWTLKDVFHAVNDDARMIRKQVEYCDIMYVSNLAFSDIEAWTSSLNISEQIVHLMRKKISIARRESLHQIEGRKTYDIRRV